MTGGGGGSDSLRQLTESAAAGAAAGGIATLAMSGAMLAAGRLGLMGEYPRERVARHGLRRSGRGPIRAEMLDGVVGAGLHVAFGAALGAAFGAGVPPVVRGIRERLRSRPRPELVLPAAGVLFASGVWLVSYWGWVPSLGILPPPDRDRLDRQASILVAHWVFGLTLGAAVARLDPLVGDGSPV
jgi:hypothetical protein